MDKDILANNIEQLSMETIECLKLLQKGVDLFQFDNETNESLNEFMNMMRMKALRVSNPRDKKDINKNIKKKVVYEEWETQI